MTGEETRISEYHKETLGIYTRVRNSDDGFTAPVYKKGWYIFKENSSQMHLNIPHDKIVNK